MKPCPIQLEVPGPIAPCLRRVRRGRLVWARPDTMPNPTTRVAPTLKHPLRLERGEGRVRCRIRSSVVPIFSAAKGIFKAILRWKSVNVRPTRCEICAPVQFHRRAFNYVAPFRDGTAPCATENDVVSAFLETLFNRPQNDLN